MESDHWKKLGTIEHVTMFDDAGMGPWVASVEVVVNAGAYEDYPACRIIAALGGAGAANLTVQQSRRLRAMLEEAERAVLAGCPALEKEGER